MNVNNSPTDAGKGSDLITLLIYHNSEMLLLFVIGNIEYTLESVLNFSFNVLLAQV